MNGPLPIGIGIALLAANAFFVAAEFAMLAARRTRIDQLAAQGEPGAHDAAAGLRELSLMLAGAQLGITICSLGLGAVAEPAIARNLESALHSVVEIPEAALHTIGFVVALSIVVLLHLVVGEMAPKSWAIAHPERAALLLARPFRAFTYLFRPVIRFLNHAANGIVRLFGVEPQDERAVTHSPTDLLLLIEESAQRGGIPADEHRLLARTIELSGLTAATAMTGRDDIVAVAADETTAHVAEVAHAAGRSRLVVHEGDLDRVVGVLHVKDILLLDNEPGHLTTVRELVRPALFTTDDRPLEEVLVDMRQAHQHLAVVGRPGAVEGVVTLDDVLGKLIGDPDPVA
jgi:CBS domain containing-hemolysin-like protein